MHCAKASAWIHARGGGHTATDVEVESIPLDPAHLDLAVVSQ